MTGSPGAGPGPSRRGLLAGAAGAVVVGGAAAAAWAMSPRLENLWGQEHWFIPDAAEGQVRVESVPSKAMGGDVGLFTAVPAGHGNGAGLPVIVVLHGASATVEEFREFGFPQLVTAAVEAGAPPFVLAGPEDGPAGWVADGDIDPPAFLREELPALLEQRGYDGGRRAVWAWSRGGYGALRLALDTPDYARAWALFSPAVAADDPTLTDLSTLAGVPVGLWCGTDDGFYDDVRAVAKRLPQPPDPEVYEAGGHTRQFWNDHTLDAFAWLADALAPADS